MNLDYKLSYLSDEEKLNVFTHFPFIFISLLGNVILLNSIDELYKFIFHAIYSFSLTFMFIASSIYHLSIGLKKKRWKKLDHISIYLLIAGSYTPVCFIAISEYLGVYILIVIWSLALLGIILKILFIERYQTLSLVLYLIMGWLIVIDIEIIFKLFSFNQLFLLIIGGLFYTTGVLFYKLDNLKYNHAIWHLFVVLGSLCHCRALMCALS